MKEYSEKELIRLNKAFLNLSIKMQKLFKSVYIVNTGYMISLDTEMYLGECYVEISDDIREYLFDTIFSGNKIIYIESVVNFRNDNTAFITDIDDMIVNEIYEKLDKCTIMSGDITTWNTLTLTEDDENRMFNQNLDIILGDRDDFPPIIITKSLFPIVTIKNYDTIKYAYHETNIPNVHGIIFTTNISDTSVYWIYHYISNR